MNLNETMNSDFKKNELLDDEYDIDDEQLIKEHEEESKYGKLASLFTWHRSKQVKSADSRQKIILKREHNSR